MEVSLAGLGKGIGWRGRLGSLPGVCLYGRGGDGAINQEREHRCSLENEDSEFGFEEQL